MRASAGPGETPAKHSILVVDDDEAFRAAVTSILRSAGYEVLTAPDYRLALEILETDKPVDLLLLDIVMPNRVNGLALARMARLRRPDINVIYLTGYDLPGLEEEALGAIIRKPVDAEVLLDATARALRCAK